MTLTGDATLDLPEFDKPPADPCALLEAWLSAAAVRGVQEPDAFVLATADESGTPSSRVVMLKSLTPRGLIFTSHTTSRKGRDLAARPEASATFHWRETIQQIQVAGLVARLTPTESDALFADRPRAAQATTAASHQGEPLTDEPALHDRAAALLASEGPIARPPHWSGYRLIPHRYEFWHGSPSRLHRRLAYTRHSPTSPWTARRLQP